MDKSQYIREIREMGRRLFEIANLMEKEDIAVKAPTSESGKVYKLDELGTLKRV
jgi:hypothetical protein